MDRRFFAPARAAFDDEVFFNGDTELDVGLRLRFSSLAFLDAMQLFSAENDPRFGQVVGGQFDFYLVPRHNPNEMFSHLARNMGKNIALSGEIDTEHRARQHLSHRTFGHDLSFLWHRAEYIRRGALLNRRGQLSILSYALERNCR